MKQNNEELKNLIKEFYHYAKEKLGFTEPIKIILRNDKINAKDPLGKTGFYDLNAKSITIYISNRHPKDLIRSLAHELIHHFQNCNGQFKNNRFGVGENYIQKNSYMRELEKEAYEKGNLILRDFEEYYKNKSNK